MKEKLNEYINNNLEVIPHIRRRLNNYQTSRIENYINENNKENKFLNHDLKNQLVESRLREIKANGASKTNTLTIIYLRE